MFSNRRWFIALQGLTIVCMLLALAPQPALGALPVQNATPQVEEPPPEETLPSATTPVAAEAEAGPAHPIYLQSRQFTPETSELTALRQAASATTQERMHVLVQLDFIPREAAKDALAAEGIDLLAYVPDYAWIASVPTSRVADVVDRPGVTWIGQLQVNDKLDPAIVADQWGSYNLTPDGVAAVYVALHADVSLDTGRAVVANYGGKITGEVIGINMLVVEMPRDNIEALAAEDIVQWIEQAAPPLEENNDGSRQQIGVNVVQASPYNLDGTGIDVLVYDSGQAGNHVDFGSRLIHGDTDSVSEHSTHVAGTVGGSGANSAAQGGSAFQWRGMAPNADLISYGTGYSGSGYIFYENVPDIEHDWAQAQNWFGADIGTASLGSNVYSNYYPGGCSIMGKYGASSVLIDQIVRGGNSVVGIGDKYIATWAAGNERGWSTSCGTYSIVAPPAAAKNPIHVGGSNTNNNTQYAHTSWGPTEDGRIKPIVTAGACQTSGDYGIKSTDNSPVDAYTVKCGTSMATPAVAGGIALMLQHYRDIYNTSGSFWPSTAKAILMQTADDLGNPGPDYQWGFGQVDIHAAVDLISRKAFRQESITQGEVDVYYFIVPDDATPATVSLAWDDYESTLNANPTLINDLDLELESPSGTTVYPWILNPASPTANATRGTDSVNNQEQVLIPDAAMEAGTWLVRVSGTSVPQGPQDYSLACEGCKLLNLGVCQDTVATLQAMANATEVPGMEGVRVPAEIVLTAGELWQQTLEATLDDGGPVEDSLAETESALQRFAIAEEQGPEAILTLADTLTGAARDLVQADVVQAHELVMGAAPPPPDVPAVSAADEAAALEAQDVRARANRALALQVVTDPAEGKSEVTPSASFSTPNRPAADLTVGNGCTYATISAAIAAANPGDTLLIEGGRTFLENVTIPMTLTLQGGYNGCASGSSARTTLDGNANSSVVIVNRALEVSLENFNITNGNTGSEGGGIKFAVGDGTGLLHLTNIDIYGNHGYWGGGLWVGLDADVIGDNVDIYDNTSTTYGGGVRLFGGRANFSNSNVYNNSAPYGAGIYATLQNGSAPRIDLPTYADVYQNTATTGDGLGGGIYLREGTANLADCSDIYGNNALTGGGVYMITSTLTIGGSCSEIDNNTATDDGGGIYAQGSTINLDNDAELYSNDATSGNGGGAYLDDSDLWSDKALVWYNTAAGYGGGVYARDGSLVDMDIDNYTCVGARCSRLYYNTASGGYGGAIYSYDSEIDLRNTFVERNTGVLGGAIYAYAAPVYLYNDLLTGNNATSTSGDGVRLYIDSALYGNNNTFAYNDANYASTGRAIDIYDSTGTMTLGCSVIWGHTSSVNQTGHNVTYSDIQGGYSGDGNLNSNPLFVSYAARDFHLTTSSPLIDRCLTGTSPDFDNEVRPIVRQTAASPYDMGADEVSGVMRVGLNGDPCVYSTIQQAIHAAVDGDTVQVAEGVYFENLNIRNKDITITGGYDSTCVVTGTETTRVEGSASSARVVYAYNSDLTLRNLELAWGSGTGAGLYATTYSHVTLDNVGVTANHGGTGGGLYVSDNSSVNAINGSAIYGNTATGSGGGGYVYGDFATADASIYSNCAGQGGGLYLEGGSEAMLATTIMYANEAASTNGGGIYATLSTVNLENTQVGLNQAAGNGGGLFLTNNSTLNAQAVEIGFPVVFLAFGNLANYGGGLYAENSTVDFEGNVRLNQATYSGGGIYANGSALSLNNSSVGNPYGNSVSASGYYGAGIYLTNNSQTTISNTVVASNTFQSTSNNYGGGAYVTGGSMLTLTNGSEIAYHDFSAVNFGRGAGVYLNGGMLTLDDSIIHYNTASRDGGGVRMSGISTLNMRNGAQIRDNQALNEAGGGIVAYGTPDINIEDSTLRDNTAGTDGGAIYTSAGMVDFTGGWTLRENSASGNGGAVAVVGTADAYFRADNYSLVYFNRALGGHGGMVYLGNNTTAQLYATSGSQMYVYANSASGNGGALYADNGGYFDVYGQVDFHRNRADNGGAVYLANNSRLWLDDYFDIAPELWDNWADNGSGGAVYASNSPSVQCDGVRLGRIDDGNHATEGDGGALYLSGSTLDADNCLFIDNEASVNGGAVAAYTSTLNVRANYVSPLTMAVDESETRDGLAPLAPAATACDPTLGPCSAFFENVADRDGNGSGDGGAIYNNDGTFTLRHTTLYTNTAYRGGAIYQTGTNASAQVENTLIYSNTVSLALGAGIRTAGGAFTITHATLANNFGGSGFSGVASAAYNTIAWDNDGYGGFAAVPLTASCNIDDGSNAGINVDPHFVDAANWDYHLFGDSPAIDACATGLTPDLDNTPRPVSTAYDMGAYEYPYGINFATDLSDVGYPAQDVIYVHTLTNVGGVMDTFTFTGLSSQGWIYTLPPATAVAAGQTVPVTVTLHVPAGVLSGTVDILNVTATSQADPTLTAVVTDTTTIGFAPDLVLTPLQYVTLGASEGSAYNYTHILTNTGNAQDTFNLTFSSSRGWGGLLTSTPIILNPNQSANVNVQVNVPIGGAGLTDLSVVTVTSTGGAGPVAALDTTSAFVPGLAFAPDYTTEVSADTIVTYTHTLTNTGAATDTYALASFSSQGWATLLDPGPFTLPGDGTATVRVQVTTPPGSGGMMDSTWVTATSAGGADPVGVHDTTSVYMPGMAFVPDYTQTIPTNSEITYTHRLTNTGADTDTFDVGLASSSEGWASLVDTGPFTLNAGAGTDVRVHVVAPAGSGGLTDVAVVTATSRAGSLSGLSASVTDTTTAIRTYGVDFAPNHTQSLTPGDTFTYTHWLANTGSGTDQFALTFNTSRGWSTLLDPGPFDLDASTSIAVRVRVDVPAGSGGLTEVARVVATSQLSPTVSAAVTDTTMSIYQPGITLVPDHNQSVATGTTLTYTHWLTNSGNGADQFMLDFSTSEAWATLLDPGPFALDAGEGISLNVRVDVPVGSGGMVDTSILTATAMTGGVADTATDTTTAIHIPGVDIAPDYAQSVVPDGSFIYVHTLENTGNGPDTFSITLTTSAGWTTLLDPGPFTLGTGESTQVRASVLVPSGLISGTASDIAVVTATSYADSLVEDTATDTTSVGFAPGALFVDDELTLNATPATQYNYTHWLTNTGNYTDTFNLTFDSSMGWGTLLDPGPFVLGMGEATSVGVQVDVPAGGADEFDTSVVTATSEGGAGPLMVHDTTAAFMPSITLTPEYAELHDPGDVVTYMHTLQNTGTTTDVIALTLDSSQSWAVLQNPGPHTLGAGQSLMLSVVVTIPLGSGGLVDVSQLTAQTLNGFGPSVAVTDTTTVSYVPGVALGPDFAQTVPAGSAVIYTHYLTNTGTGPDTFSVAMASSQGWGALLDSGPFTLAAGDSTPVRVQVSVPTDTLPLLEDVTTLTATLGALTAVAHDTTTVACEPIVDADFTYAPAPIAVNRSTTFTGTAMGSRPQTYTWDFGDGTAVQAGNPTVHTFSTPGSFTVTLMVANPCTAQYSMTRAVMVYALPDLTLDPTVLNVAVPLDGAITRTIDLGNVGSADLIWSLVMTPTVTWLDVTPTNGNVAPAGSVPLSAEFDATGLPEDVYTTTLRLTSNDPDTPLVILPVTMTVGGAWNIYLPLVLRNY